MVIVTTRTLKHTAIVQKNNQTISQAKKQNVCLYFNYIISLKKKELKEKK